MHGLNISVCLQVGVSLPSGANGMIVSANKLKATQPEYPRVQKCENLVRPHGRNSHAQFKIPKHMSRPSQHGVSIYGRESFDGIT